MTDLLRQEIASCADTVVVKVGTRVLTHADGTLDVQQIARLSEQLCALADMGRRLVLVSSGAVGAGLSQLGLHSRPTDVAQLQAVAAVGQARLIQAYDQLFQKHGRVAAQVLLTADDLNDRTRYLNVRNTLLSLLDYGVIPILNENDTVAVDELVATFGDNDYLAALVTNLLRASLLIILSDVDGLYDRDPQQAEAKIIPLVTRLDDSVFSLVQDHGRGPGRGGMASKLRAARIVTTAGENVIIAGGRQKDVLQRTISGEMVGTLVLAQGKSISPRKRWIGFSAQPAGAILLDPGAAKAIVHDGRSLLPVGIVGTEGSFRKGDLVSLRDGQGREIARGLTNYHAEDVERIKGLHSARIAQVLGHSPYEEVIHRDNLTVLESSGS